MYDQGPYSMVSLAMDMHIHFELWGACESVSMRGECENIQCGNECGNMCGIYGLFLAYTGRLIVLDLSLAYSLHKGHFSLFRLI